MKESRGWGCRVVPWSLPVFPSSTSFLLYPVPRGLSLHGSYSTLNSLWVYFKVSWNTFQASWTVPTRPPLTVMGAEMPTTHLHVALISHWISPLFSDPSQRRTGVCSLGSHTPCLTCCVCNTAIIKQCKFYVWTWLKYTFPVCIILTKWGIFVLWFWFVCLGFFTEDYIPSANSVVSPQCFVTP